MEFFKHEKSIGKQKNPRVSLTQSSLFLIPHLNDIQDLSGNDGVSWAMSERKKKSLGKLEKSWTPKVPEKKSGYIYIYVYI